MEIIDLGSNLNWNRLHSFTALARPKNDIEFPGRIADSIYFTYENRLIITVDYAGIPKPWWITAGRVSVDLNFQFDSVNEIGNRLHIHQQQLLLGKANLIWMPRYEFPYTIDETKHRLHFRWNKWLAGVNVEIFEADF